ncbi:MAG: vgb 3 [Verrucomicrobiales bacterium]|nr:vgb 3 [Verrucomicrobiales bacterium]
MRSDLARGPETAQTAVMPRLLNLLLPVLLLHPSASLRASEAESPIHTIAGTGKEGTTGDGGPALQAGLNNPFGITRGPDGLLYFCEYGGHVIRRIEGNGRITALAGTGQPGYAGDGGPALKAQLNTPHEIRFGPDGRLYVSDMKNHAIRVLDLRSGTLGTFAGTGQPGFSGDGGPAMKAQFREPISLEFGPDGLLYICDIGNQRVRVINTLTGSVRTLCGNGQRAMPPDGAPFSPDTALSGPRTIAFDVSGNLWLALRDGNSLYRVDRAGQFMHLAAGTGKSGFEGNGGPAIKAQLAGPKGLAVSPAGNIYIADTESHSIRRILAKSGVIEVVAGTGRKGNGPDSGPATQCQLARPHGVFLDRDGTLYIGDSENHRIRAVKVE